MQNIRDRLLAAAGLPPDTPIPPVDIDRRNGSLPPLQPASDEPTCPRCGDAGFVRRDLPPEHPDFGKAYPCPCSIPTPEAVMDRLGQLSRMPPTSRDLSRFKTWRDVPPLRPALEVARRYAKGEGAHPFLTLAGRPGTGKTHLALAIGWEWLDAAQGTVLYWRVASLLDYLRAGYSREEKAATPDTYTTIYAVANCGLLILDDLGAEVGTEWATEKLDTIVDERYVNRRHTVVTTNATDAELPERLADRLHEGTTLVLSAASFRRQQRRRPQP